MLNKSGAKSYQMDMCTGSILKKMLIFSLPLMASSMLQLLFNAADIIVVGRFAGDNALAAVGSNTALINLLTNFFMGLSIGANVLVARYFGAKNDKDLSETVHTAMMLSIYSGIILTVIGVLCAKQILIWMQTPEAVLGLATVYLRIYFLGMTATMIYNFGSAILRAVGDTKRPLYYLFAAGIVNVILNLIFVIGFKLSVMGVAIATVISQCISAFLILKCMVHESGSIRLDLRNLGINKEKFIKIVQIGLPASLQGVIFSLSNVVIQSSVNSFGSIAMAGYTAANNILGFLYMSVNSITQACMSFTSQNYGVGKLKRMDKVLRDCAILSISIAAVLGGLAYSFGPQILTVYTSDPKVINCGMEILAYTSITYFLCGIMDLFPGALRGMGYSAVPMVLSVIGTVGTRIVWVFGIFPNHRSLSVLFVSYPVSWILTIVLQVMCFYFVRKRVHQKEKRLL